MPESASGSTPGAHAPQPRANPGRGILLKVGSVVVFMGMSVLIKTVSDRVPPGEIVFFRSAFAMPVILVWLWMRHDLATGLRVRDPAGHLWRGLIGATAMGLSFTALGLLPLPEVTAIGYASPLLVTVFAAMFLGERIRAYRLGAVVLGLVGVVIVLSPRLSVIGEGDAGARETLGAVVMLMAAVFMALAAVFVRKLVRSEETSAIVFFFSLTCTVLSLATLPFGWVWPTAAEAAALVAAGLLGGLAQILLTSSYRHADTAVIAPFEYTSMLLAIAAGWFLFGEAPSVTVLGGAALVVVAGLIIIWREAALGRERARARKVMTPQG